MPRPVRRDANFHLCCGGEFRLIALLFIMDVTLYKGAPLIVTSERDANPDRPRLT
jgi:hypothetical protein